MDRAKGGPCGEIRPMIIIRLGQPIPTIPSQSKPTEFPMTCSRFLPSKKRRDLLRQRFCGVLLQVQFVEGLARTSVGKLNKRAMREAQEKA